MFKDNDESFIFDYCVRGIFYKCCCLISLRLTVVQGEECFLLSLTEQEIVLGRKIKEVEQFDLGLQNSQLLPPLKPIKSKKLNIEILELFYVLAISEVDIIEKIRSVHYFEKQLIRDSTGTLGISFGTVHKYAVKSKNMLKELSCLGMKMLISLRYQSQFMR